MADIEEQAGAAETRGARLVTVLYSRHGDVYKLPALGMDLWLSVETHPSFVPSVAAISVLTADGKASRRGYRNWSVIEPGRSAALPEEDPLVVDYTATVNAVAQAKACGHEEPPIPKRPSVAALSPESAKEVKGLDMTSSFAAAAQDGAGAPLSPAGAGERDLKE
jgi:hypothetical protein